MKENNKYGYNLCYIEKGHKRKHRYITTNTYGLAEFEKRRCEQTPQRSRRDNHLIREPTWVIVPLTKKQAKYIWSKCPF